MARLLLISGSAVQIRGGPLSRSNSCARRVREHFRTGGRSPGEVRDRRPDAAESLERARRRRSEPAEDECADEQRAGVGPWVQPLVEAAEPEGVEEGVVGHIAGPTPYPRTCALGKHQTDAPCRQSEA